MTNPQAQLEAFLKVLIDHVAVLEVKFEIFRVLEGASEQEVEALNCAPAFFGCIHDSLLADLIIGIHKLFDPSPNNKKGIRHFLKLVRGDAKLVAHCFFPASVPGFDPPSAIITMVSRYEQDIVDFEPFLKIISAHRDKHRAHNDAKYFGKSSQLFREHPIKMEELEQVIDWLQALLHSFYRAFCKVDAVMTPTNADDIKELTRRLMLFQKWSSHPGIQEVLSENPSLWDVGRH